MTLRELVHYSIDELDDSALAVVYEQIKLLLPTRKYSVDQTRVPSIEEVWELLSADKSSWSDDIVAEREGRA